MNDDMPADIVAAQEALAAGDAAAASRLADPIARDVGRRAREIATACRVLALAAWSGRDLRGAEANFAREVALLREAEDGSALSLSNALSDLGIAHYYLGKPEAALAAREESLALAEPFATEQPGPVRGMKRRLAQSYQGARRHEEALRLYREARPAPDDPADEHISWLTSMALYHEELAEIRTALDYTRQLVEVTGRSQDAGGLVAALGNAVQLLLDLEDFPAAAENLRLMRRQARKDRRYATRLALIDTRLRILSQRRRIAPSLRLAEEAERLVRDTAPGHAQIAERVVVRAGLLAEAGRDAEALDLLDAEWKAAEEPGPDEIGLAVRLADMKGRDGDFEAAREHLAAALAADLGLTSPMTRWQVFHGLTELAGRTGRSPAGILFGKLALEHVHGVAQSIASSGLRGWLRTQLSTYETVLDHLVSEGRLIEASGLQIRRSGQLAWGLSPMRSGRGAPGESVPYREWERNLRDAYVDLDAKVREAMHPGGDGLGPGAARDEARRWLEMAWAGTTAPARPAGPVSGIPPGPAPRGERSAHLSFLRQGGRLAGLLVDEEGEVRFEVEASIPDLARHLRYVRSGLVGGEAERQDVTAGLAALHDALIAPVSDRIGTGSRLEMTLSGFLSFVPAAALFDGERYLVERVTPIRRIGPGAARRPRSGGYPDAVVFGGGAGGAIPDALVEADLVARIVDGRRATGAEFTAARLRRELSRRPSLVHIASHFRYRADHPHLSWLELGTGEALALEALAGREYDFAGLDLLVLSCCSTGISDEIEFGFEGFAGLAIGKGAGAVIGSLWDVGDAATRALMDRFYGHLVVDRDAPPEALARAQRGMIGTPEGGPRRGGIGGGSPPEAGAGRDWAAFAIYA